MCPKGCSSRLIFQYEITLVFLKRILTKNIYANNWNKAKRRSWSVLQGSLLLLRSEKQANLSSKWKRILMSVEVLLVCKNMMKASRSHRFFWTKTMWPELPYMNYDENSFSNFSLSIFLFPTTPCYTTPRPPYFHAAYSTKERLLLQPHRKVISHHSKSTLLKLAHVVSFWKSTFIFSKN